MRIAFVVAVIVVAALASCAHSDERRAARSREARAIDTSTVFAEPEPDVRAAATRALVALGYDVVDGDVIATKPRADTVAGWRWLDAGHPGAALGASTVATIASGNTVPLSAGEGSSTGNDPSIAVSYRIAITGSADGTVVEIEPVAQLDGNDVTERYLVALEPDALRRRCGAMFDAIRDALRAPPPATTASSATP